MVTSLYVDLFATPVTNEVKSARRFVEAAAPHLSGVDDIRLFGDDYSGFYNLYLLRTRLPEVRSAAELENLLARPHRFAVIGEEKAFERRARRVAWQGHVLLRRRVGHRVMLVVGRTNGR